MSLDAFDDAPVLTGPTLELRPMTADDIGPLTEAGSAPETWAGHPATDRWRPEVFVPYAEMLLRAGGTLVVRLRASGQVIGASRFYRAEGQQSDVNIGFTFLDHRHWGGRANFEMKALMLDHAFASVQTVGFHIAPSNIRSRRATAKLGAREIAEGRFALGGPVQDWVVLQLTRPEWLVAAAIRRADLGYTDT